MVPVIKKYFPEFSAATLKRFAVAIETYKHWNSKINVISRKDIDNIETHHFLHALSVLKFTEYKQGITVLDVGSGGGFPALPLAIALPKVEFTLLEATNKKLKVAEAVTKATQCQNVALVHRRTENFRGQFDIITGRAVVALPQFVNLVQHSLKPGGRIYYWCGSDEKDNYKKFFESKGWQTELYLLNQFFNEQWFGQKIVVSLLDK